MPVQSKVVELDVNVGSALIDMYSKCGTLEEASILFGRLPERNAVAWSSMVAGFSQCNHYRQALKYFEGMQKEGFKPDDVAFLSLLSTCNHMGLVDEGLHYLKSMREHHHVEPSTEHYNCIIDLLGRTGHLKEAEVLLETMPFQPDIVGLTSLLGHCRTHGNVHLGRRCFQYLVGIDDRNAAGYVMMSNVYSRAGMCEEASRVEKLRKCANAWKKPGKAFVEVDMKVHDFVVGDNSHPQSLDIDAKLQRLALQMEEQGYLPQSGSVVQLISDEDTSHRYSFVHYFWAPLYS